MIAGSDDGRVIAGSDDRRVRSRRVRRSKNKEEQEDRGEEQEDRGEEQKSRYTTWEA